MSTQEKRKDDELEVWVIVGALFTLGLLFFDFFYSSVNEMAQVARIAIWVGHALVSLGWIISLIQWKNPNYDDTRKGVVGLCVVLMFIIGIHHASVKEAQSVIDDSNAAKQEQTK